MPAGDFFHQQVSSHILSPFDVWCHAFPLSSSLVRILQGLGALGILVDVVDVGTTWRCRWPTATTGDDKLWGEMKPFALRRYMGGWGVCRSQLASILHKTLNRQVGSLPKIDANKGCLKFKAPSVLCNNERNGRSNSSHQPKSLKGTLAKWQ